MYKTLGQNLTVAIAGASGGIGSELLNLAIQDPSVTRIYALGRTMVQGDSVYYIPIDYDDFDPTPLQSIQHIDILIIATGVLTIPHQRPEKSLSHLNAEHLSALYRINAMGPILLFSALKHAFSKKSPSLCVMLSAKVGSISDNHLGGWYSYRASKAGLNMLMRSASIEIKRTHPMIVTAYHPGTVSTENFKFYQTNVPDANLQTPMQAAERLWANLEKLKPAYHGHLIDYHTQIIPF